MNKFLFAVLAVFSINAFASNDVYHPKADGTAAVYTTYQAKDMKHTVDNNWMYVVYRSCTRLNAEQVIKREKLASNPNIVGALKCGGNYDRTVILLRDLRQVKDDQIVLTK